MKAPDNIIKANLFFIAFPPLVLPGKPAWAYFSTSRPAENSAGPCGLPLGEPERKMLRGGGRFWDNPG
jgi:hypothetical protein